MQRRLTIVGVLAGVLFAASATAAAVRAPDVAAQGAAPQFETALALHGCAGNCYEPSIAADRMGRLFVTSGSGGAIGVSSDGGRSFSRRPAPPALVPGSSFADAIAQVAPDGRLFFSALVMYGGPVLVQVAWSRDGARTWGSNVLVGTSGIPSTPAPDRQWLGFGLDGAVYLSYSQIPTGIWVLRSDDGGAKFATSTRATPNEGRATLGQAGPVVVAPDGKVVVPFFSQPPTPRGGAVRLAVSSDRGKTFTLSDVVSAGPNRSEGGGFPIFSSGPAGRRWVTWWDGASTAVATSSDGGRHWSPPKFWEPQSPSWSCPWIAGRSDGRADVLWYASGASATDVVFARGDDRGARTIVSVARGIPLFGSTCNTDYGHFVLQSHDCAAVVYATRSAVWSSVERGECR